MPTMAPGSKSCFFSVSFQSVPPPLALAAASLVFPQTLRERETAGAAEAKRRKFPFSKSHEALVGFPLFIATHSPFSPEKENFFPNCR